MIFRFTVSDPSSLRTHDVELTAEPHTAVGSLLAALPATTAGRTCYVGDEPLDPAGALRDSPLTVGGYVSVGRPGLETMPAAGTVAVLRIVSGPDAGRSFPLIAGLHRIGREPSSDVQLLDPLVSRHHANLTVMSQRAAITNTPAAEAANGTTLDGQPLVGTQPVPSGAMLQLGDEVLEYLALPARALHTTRSSDGRLEFDRAYAPAPVIQRTDVQLPAAPGAGGGLKAMLAAVAAPVVLGVVMALALRQWQMLLFAAFAPATAAGSYFSERRQRRTRSEDFEARKAATAERIGTAVDAEERLRRELAPDPAAIMLTATGAARGLWPRNADSPDGLLLRAGTADRPAGIDLRGEPWPGFETPVLHSVPVLVDLRETGVLGVVGADQVAGPFTNWLLAQLATLRSPDDLRIVVLAPDGSRELAWTRWLPHTEGTATANAPCAVGNTAPTRAARIEELRQLISARQDSVKESGAATGFEEDVVVVLQGALALRNLPGMRELLRDGYRVGVYSICIDERDMNECRGVLQLDAEQVTVRRHRGDRPTVAHPETLSTAYSEHLARALAPMRDRLTRRGDPSSIPYPVRFLDLLGVERPSAQQVLEHWRAVPGPCLKVPLGVDAQGTVLVDLAGQGPHTMLAGATGAGKSILLQTLVTSLLLANRPDELNLVLVDFKGGSAFLPFEHCPHVVALIRNTEDDPAERFDEAAAARVLASVRAEVRRRESILGRFGGEIDQYWTARAGRPDLPALPRLVMVFDEYARAMDTSPDFPRELVAVAGKGRSLGMHLVFATQSLQGKLSTEMKNNISLRITLRQNEKSDSVEVLGVPDAVTIPGRLRGRGLILCTLDESRQPRAFQSGYLGDPPPSGSAAPARIRIVDWPAVGLPRPEGEAAPAGLDSDQDLAIAAIEAAAAHLALAPPQRPLLPPLPARIALIDLARTATVPAPAWGLAFALADDPEHQQQPALALDLAGTDRLLIAGGPQSGRTTAVRALLSSLAGGFGPDRAQFCVIAEKEAELDDVEALPHCGAVVYASEPDRIRRLVTWLGQEVQHRTRERFTVKEPVPALVLIVDGWESLENRGNGLFDETSVLATLFDVIAAGPPVRVHVVAVGGQQLLTSRLPDSFTRRVLLPFPNDSTRRAALANGSLTVPVSLPGRAIEASSGWHLQVADPPAASFARAAALAGGEPAAELADGDVALDPVSPRYAVAGGQPPPRFPRLPLRLDVEDSTLHDEAPSPTWIPLGLGGPDIRPLGTDLFESDPHLLLISGPGGSGRSTAAATVIHGLRRAGIPVLVIAPPRSPLRTLVGAGGGMRFLSKTSLPDAELREAVAPFDGERYAVVVDDCEQLKVIAGTENFAPAPTLFDDIADPGSAGRRALVFCGDAGPILDGAARSLARIVESMILSGTRMAMSPTSLFSAKQLGITLERDQILPMPAGRGFLAAGRTSQLVQLCSSAG